MPYTRKIDRVKVLELRQKGMGCNAIARELKCSKGSVSKILAKADQDLFLQDLPIPIPLPSMSGRANVFTETLNLVQKIDKKLKGLEREIKNAKNKRDKLRWQQLEVKYLGEKRRLMSFAVSYEAKAAQVKEVRSIIHLILEEIGNESQALQQRIIQRLSRLRYSG